MEILGANIGETSEGVRLKDGSVTSITDGTVTMSIPEDRVSREKHKGGFDNALGFLLSRRGLAIRDIDRLYITTLGEETEKDVTVLPDVRRIIARYPSLSKVIRPAGSHHLNHAYSVFPFSNFDSALVVVVDMEGSVIGKKKYPEHWKNRLEHLSYYFAEKTGQGIKIRLLEREFDEEDVVGPGEMYGIFTHFCGFNSYTNSGKTMGLAPYGSNRFDKVKLYGLDQSTGKPFSLLKNNYHDSLGEISGYLAACGFNGILPAVPGMNPSDESAALARLVQQETERIIIEGIERIRKKHNIATRDLCLAGGVALNCTLNNRLLTDGVAERLFIQPACGDTGQSLGAAVYGYYREDFEKTGRHLSLNSVFLTADYKEDEILSAIRKAGLPHRKLSDSAGEVAELVAKGAIVGWFQGRGELGPRALGGRTILADPRVPQMKDILNNKVKHREPFRPFAPICTEERAAEFFEISGPTPYMLLAPKVRPRFREVFPSITHVDGTARLQTVSKKNQPLVHRLLCEFEKISGYPVMVNTSLNDGGDPLVESPGDAVDCLVKTGMDYLVMEDIIAWK